MSELVFKDTAGNNLSYPITVIGDQSDWQFDSFLDFMKLSPEAADDEGFLFAVEDRIRHEKFSYLVNSTAATLNSNLRFIQDGKIISNGDFFIVGESPPIVEISRIDEGAKIEGSGISLKKRSKNVFKDHNQIIADAIDQTLNRKIVPNQIQYSINLLIESDPDEATLIEFILHVARVIHHAPFENWSKFEEKIPYRNGHEMWVNFSKGRGGVCSEKSASLKFICDLLGIKNRPVIGTGVPLSSAQIESFNNFFISGGKTEPPCEIKHLLLEVEIGSDVYLIDVTGGNVPLMFLNESDSIPFYNSGYSVRMMSRTDKLFLSKIPEWIGDAHLAVCEYHLPDAHFDLSFNQDLGLEINDSLYTGVFFDFGGDQSEDMRAHFRKIGASQNLVSPKFFNKSSSLVNVCGRGAKFYQDARANILNSYNNRNYTGDITIVLQPLNKNFWSRPMVSQNIAELVEEQIYSTV